MLGFIFAPFATAAGARAKETRQGRGGEDVEAGQQAGAAAQGADEIPGICARVCRFLGATDVVRAFGSEPMVGMGRQVHLRANLTAEAAAAVALLGHAAAGGDGLTGPDCHCNDPHLKFV